MRVRRLYNESIRDNSKRKEKSRGNQNLKDGNRLAEKFKIACIVNVSSINRVVKNLSENKHAHSGDLR